jgi:hypothetical protein
VGGGIRDQEESPAFIMNTPAHPSTRQSSTRAVGTAPVAFLGTVVG